MKKSIWMEFSLPQYPELKEDSTCDICIIGGGITGVSLAYYLKDSSKKVILIEQNQIGKTTTGRTTAKLTYLQQDVLSKIKQARGFTAAKKYYQAQRDSIEEIVNIIKKENISCHLEKSPSYLYIKDGKNISKLEKEFQLYKNVGAQIQMKEKLPFNCGEKLCCSVSDTYVFHPLEYLNGLLSSLRNSSVSIYEQTRMVQYEKDKDYYQIFLANGRKIMTKKLVFAGCYPPTVFPAVFPIRAYIEKDFVEVIPVDKHYSFNAINLDKELLSIRFFENYMIKTKHSTNLSKSSITKKNYIKEIPDGYSWSNYDLVTTDSLPIVGYVGNSNNGFYIASGFQTWGMTNSNLAAGILRDTLLGKENKYAKLCNPKRGYSVISFLNATFNVFKNIYHFTESYIPLFKKGKIVWKDGKRMGIARDSSGKVHKVRLTCPHMKCGLVYNKKEETWDCPCHGSRFDINGQLLRGPATDCVRPDTLS